MGPVLVQEETGVPGENLRCLVKSNWTTLFSHLTKVTNQITAWSWNRTLVTVVKDTCTTTVLLAPHFFTFEPSFKSLFLLLTFAYQLVLRYVFYTFCCPLPENILSLTPTSNSLTQTYIHFIQSTFTSVDTQPFPSKANPIRQQTTINTIALFYLAHQGSCAPAGSKHNWGLSFNKCKKFNHNSSLKLQDLLYLVPITSLHHDYQLASKVTRFFLFWRRPEAPPHIVLWSKVQSLTTR